MNVVNLHIRAKANIGDAVCAPALYLPLGKRKNTKDFNQNDPVVIWGGGCLADSAIPQANKAKGIKIAWAIGGTERRSTMAPLPRDYSVFDLAGVRDYPGNENRWLPCASCLSPAFDKIREPSKKIVYYGHHSISPLSEINNNLMDFEKVVEHLASGEIVVTSSYHGMVWGTWLGRKVEVRPFGSKFYGWPYEWGKIHMNALQEARKLNLEFYDKVKRLIGQERNTGYENDNP